MATIAERHRAGLLRDGKLAEWQIKHLASVIAATAQTDQKGYKQLARTIEAWSFSLSDEKDDEGNPLPAEPQQMTEAEIEEMLEKGNEAAAEKNSASAVMALASNPRMAGSR